MLKKRKENKKKVTISKKEYQEIQQEKKENKWKKLKEYARLLNFNNLNTKINQYGYNYSLSKYILNIIILMGVAVLSSYFFKLEWGYTIILGIWSIFLLPIIILSQIKFLHNNNRFEEITTYLQESIMLFQMNPKISYTLREVSELFDSKNGIHRYISKAIHYIENSQDGGQDVYAKGLKIIEVEYPCSRIQSLHRLMITVENQNSKEYQNSLNDLYEDIRGWITRTYTYQLDLKHLKNQFNIVLGLTILVTALMINILPNILTAFVSSSLYQMLTMLMLGSFILMFALVQSRLNGQWLVNDVEKDDKKILKSIKIIENYDKEAKRKDSFIKAGICSVIPLVGLYLGNQNYVILGVIATLIMITWNTLEYNSAYKLVKKEIEKNYPIWLRDVSLNMHNLVVTRAIKQSMDTAPTVIQYYLKSFIEEVEQDPVSIKPYNNFLKQFYISDVKASMKSLFSIKQSNAEDATHKISDLIVRNQDMMKKSEQIRNKNQLTGVTLIGYIPLIVGGGKMIIDMVMMLMYFMSNIMIG